VEPGTIEIEDIIQIIDSWKESVVKLDRMIYEDAKKEFSLPTHTSFGLDGDKEDRIADFEQVRGDFDSNIFVKTVLDHIEEKTKLGDRMIEKLKKIL